MMLEALYLDIALLVLTAIIAPYLRKQPKILYVLASLALAFTLLVSLEESLSGTIATGEIATDWFTSLILTIVLADVLVVVASSFHALNLSPEGPSFIATLLLGITGLIGLSHAGTILMLLVSWILVSVTSYAMIALMKDKYSASGATKYGLMSLASSMLLLLSLTFVTTQDQNLSITPLSSPPIIVAVATLAFSVAAFGFKAGIFPFHAWLPDTYGISDPYPIAVVAPISKAAVILAFYKLSILIAPIVSSHWLTLLGILSVLTMTYGNITALLQKGFQGILAYSSIAHAGYILIGIAALSLPDPHLRHLAMLGLLMQLVTYSFAKTGLFLLAKLIRQKESPPLKLEHLNGLSRVDGSLAASSLILVLSLMGMPPLVGFWGKLFLFFSVAGPAPWLTAIALINTGIAAAYYSRIIKAMYFEPGSPNLSKDRGLKVAVIISAIISLLAGFTPIVLPIQ
ncbi:MAG: hypothetical protein JHC26_12205 [Thermofilum sp.]|jgi:NADH-quinone oxidoreductase subunit N|uniref:NADH-quinone oxidoreductase subunit N n=1 Tax=Thermofilum sp. TaxID=1961369 RepID=UPI00258AF4B7|nr:proton-conducting transporter membrane subunit [Thermofilum sp.]MCI4409848.1 hypothetical protein [Thermofilum sp.]